MAAIVVEKRKLRLELDARQLVLEKEVAAVADYSLVWLIPSREHSPTTSVDCVNLKKHFVIIYGGTLINFHDHGFYYFKTAAFKVTT